MKKPKFNDYLDIVNQITAGRDVTLDCTSSIIALDKYRKMLNFLREKWPLLKDQFKSDKNDWNSELSDTGQSDYGEYSIVRDIVNDAEKKLGDPIWKGAGKTPDGDRYVYTIEFNNGKNFEIRVRR